MEYNEKTVSIICGGIKMEKKLDSLIDPNYKRIIDECAKDQKNLEISNGNSIHATYLIKALFKNAEKEIRIYTGSLSDEIFGNDELIDTAIKFLTEKEDRSVKIAYQEICDEDTIKSREFVKEILNNDRIKNKLEVWDVSSAYKDITNHFTLMDETAYRFETDHENKRAIANFGDYASAKTLKGSFADIIGNKKSKLIDLFETDHTNKRAIANIGDYTSAKTLKKVP